MKIRVEENERAESHPKVGVGGQLFDEGHFAKCGAKILRIKTMPIACVCSSPKVHNPRVEREFLLKGEQQTKKYKIQ